MIGHGGGLNPPSPETVDAKRVAAKDYLAPLPMPPRIVSPLTCGRPLILGPLTATLSFLASTARHRDTIWHRLTSSHIGAGTLAPLMTWGPLVWCQGGEGLVPVGVHDRTPCI